MKLSVLANLYGTKSLDETLSILTSLGVSDWLYGLIMDGILAGVGAAVLLGVFFIAFMLYSSSFFIRSMPQYFIIASQKSAPAIAMILTTPQG